MSKTTLLPKLRQSWLRKQSWLTLISPVVGSVIGLLIGAVLILVAGRDPIVAYQTMLHGAFGGKLQLTETILRASPLLMMGLGMTVSFRARVWNIGGEGQFYMGALFGGIVALMLPNLPSIILIPLMLLMALLGGFIWSLIPGLLKIKRGMSEIITTLMMNYIAILLMEYLTRGPLQDSSSYLPQSAQLGIAARLPNLIGRIHVGVLISVLLVPMVYFFLQNTPFGFKLRAIGSRLSVAHYAGFPVDNLIILAITISGSLCGLAGIIEVSTLHSRLKGSISGGYGFSAILVALLGRMHPIGVLFAAIFFSALRIGAEAMHALYGLPITLADVIQAIVVLSVLAADAYARRRH